MRRVIALALVVVGLAASAATAQPSTTPTVKVSKTRLGTILVDGRGRTLYLFIDDRNGSITCTTGLSNCPAVWPPLFAKGKPVAGPGVDAKLLGTVHRTQPAGTQVTYAGHPLYTFSSDEKPGDLNGQGFITAWYVVSPAGKPIKRK